MAGLLNVLVHLPRLRLADAPLEFGEGFLVQPSWEEYDSWTLGAYNSWREAYDATAPVFLQLTGPMDSFVVPGKLTASALEIKMSDLAWEALPEPIRTFCRVTFQDQVEPAWAALALAAPREPPDDPRYSTLFMIPSEAHHLVLGEFEVPIARVQGPADQEFVFSPVLAGQPLPLSQLSTSDYLAIAREALAGGTRADHSLAAATRALLSSASATLTVDERLVLVVSALESLLAPQSSGRNKQDLLAGRVSDLLGGDAQQTARSLYRARSRAVHGGSPAMSHADRSDLDAQQLLADVIIASIADRAEAQRREHPAQSTSIDKMYPLEPQISSVKSSHVNLESPEGVLTSHAPLLGLAYDGEWDLEGGVRLDEFPCALMLYSADEVLSLLPRNLRLDFAASRTFEEPVAGLMSMMRSADTVDAHKQERLLRPRNLGVLGLRLTGFRSFVDPELFGWYIYSDTDRTIRPTVFVQSVIMKLANPQGHLTDADVSRLLQVMALVSKYDSGRRSSALEEIFDLFRQSHDADFLQVPARLTLLFSCAEKLLGDFPGKRGARPEDLATRLPNLNDEPMDWFVTEGFQLRNRNAHGDLNPSDGSDYQVNSLLDVIAACILHLLELNASNPTGEPVRQFHRALLG